MNAKNAIAEYDVPSTGLWAALVFVVSLNLRPAIAAVGPLLTQIGADLSWGEGVQGVLTAIPLLAFAAVSPLVTFIERRVGVDMAILSALLCIAVGNFIRSYCGNVGIWLGTVIFASSIAVGNVLVPVIVKRDYAGHIAMATGVYSGCITVGAATAGLISAPLAQVWCDWRASLAVWSVPPLVVAALWALRILHNRQIMQTTVPNVTRTNAATTSHESGYDTFRCVLRRPMTWYVTVFMGLQSSTFYTMSNWIPSVSASAGFDASTAGVHLFIFQGVGILSGLIGSACYNKYKTVKLPDALAFFSGKRAVAIFTAIYSIVAALVLFVVWPLVYGGLVALGEAFIGMGAVGAGIYAFFNRLLIPFGLHHALNSVFWFDVAGISDLSKFWGNTGVYGQTGMYMTGFFPFMMFGLPAACIAMYQTAKPAKKKMVYGLLASAAFCSFFTGVTEPIEFSFMFLAPGLYVVHALLAGITAGITVALPIRAGFSFSGGAVDMVLSSFTPLAENPWLLIPVGIAVGVLYYIVFRFAITKFNLKTPGREDDDAEELKVTLANNDYTSVAKIVLEGVGGPENVTSIDNCITRLRLEVKDYTKVNEKVIKSAGVAGVIRPSKTAVQVIIGTQVQFVADEFKKLCK